MLPGGHDNFTENTHFERGDITLTARRCFVRDLLLRGSAFKTARGGGKGGEGYILLYGDRDRSPPPQIPAGSFVKGGSGPSPEGSPVAAGRALCRAAEAKCRPHGPPAIPCPPEARPLPAAGRETAA